MYCKYCGKKMNKDSSVCPHCGKNNGADTVKVILAAVLGVLVVAAMVLAVYVSTYGWPDFSMDASTSATEAPGTTPTDGNPDDVTCKGTYSGTDAEVLAAKDVVVATMGEYTLTNGQLQVYYWMQVVDFLNYWGNYAGYFGLDYTKPLDQQLEGESGQSWQQYFLQGALETWQRDHAFFLEAEKNGYEMEDEYQEYLDGLYESMQELATEGGYETVEAMLQADLGAAADFAGYKYYIERYYKGNLYYNDSVGKVQVSMDEIETYFEKHKEDLKNSYGVDKESGILVDMEYVHFYPEGATKETIGSKTFDQAAWDAALKKAQDMMDKWVADGAKEEDFEKLMNDAATGDDKGVLGGTYDHMANFSTSEVDVRHILITPEGGTKDDKGNTVYSDAEWEACRQKAQALLDGWVAGGATEEAFIELCKANSKDGNASTGGLYANVTKGKMVETFDAWIFDTSRQPGDYGLVKTPYGYHLMYFVHGDTELDIWAFDAVRKEGDYAIIKTDYGYSLVRFVASEEGWILYTREQLQAEKMAEECTGKYPLTVDYEKILLAVVKLGG